MKKTKILIALFVILLGGCIFGAVKMLMLTKNQKIEDFKIETVNGYDAAVMNDILLDVDYDYKLGLSATPEIEDDFERTELVYENFGGIVFQYSLDKAIRNGFLTPYNYHPIFVDLTDKEMKKICKKLDIP